MELWFPYGKDRLRIEVPDGAEVFASRYPEPAGTAGELVVESVRAPVGGAALSRALSTRRAGEVAVVVSDATRPIPYAAFLPELLAEVESAGVRRSEIVVVIATGMHRPSTAEERREMFGSEVPGRYEIVDHRADDDAQLVELPRPTPSGARVRIDRRFMAAGFRMITGLVEPHFMAGFSGGRKAVCPGLADLGTVRNFHGARFLSDPRAAGGNLEGNPLHEEALGVARQAGVDFSVNVVLDGERRVVRSFAGDLDAAHLAACEFVAGCACRRPQRPADVALTSCGGHPLDGTFYQCVKGMVSCLPAVRTGGAVIAFGGCAEGVGSPEYAAVMRDYSGRWREFLADIARPGSFIKDQWEFQMHCRALSKLGAGRLHFVSDGLPAEELSRLSVVPHAADRGRVQEAVQALVDRAAAAGESFAVFPEGPYCIAV